MNRVTGQATQSNADALLRQAVVSGPEAVLRAGAAALRSGVAPGTIPVVEAYVERQDDSRLWLLLGLLNRNIEDFAASLAALERAGELAPNDPMVATNRAFTALEAGLPSVGLFERALALSPAEEITRLGMTTALASEGRAEEAIRRLEAELRDEPQWLRGHSRLARMRWANGEVDGATASFARALARRPGDVALWCEYVETLFHAGRFQEALRIVGDARRAAGHDLSFLAAEAKCLSSSGDLDAAAALFERLAGFRDAGVTEHHVRNLIRQGRIGEAGRLAESFAEQGSDDRFWPYLSLVWRMTDDPRWEWLEGDPGFIGVYDIADRLPSLEALADALRSIHLSRGQPLDQSLRGGTQTEGNLLNRIAPAIAKLRRAVVETVEEHVANLPPHRAGHPLLRQVRSPIRFAGSWSVRLSGGGAHVNHFHPAGWISSALYVALPDRLADGEGWLTLGEATELGVSLAPIRTVEPKPGRLVLFPSTMWHGTRPFAEGERLTVAFDVKRPG